MKAFPGAQWVVAAIFLVFLAATLGGAVIAAMSRRVIRGVCGLALCCVGLAGLFYFLHSPFLSLMELLIYVGAVCVTIVFVVMLAEPEEPADERPGSGVWWTVCSVAVAGLVFLGLARLAGLTSTLTPVRVLGDDSVKAVGAALLTTFSAAFEIISLVLLVAILGALAIARTGRGKG